MSKKIWTYIRGGIFVLAGLLLIFLPEQTFTTLVLYIGTLIVITGIVKLITIFINKDQLLMPGNYLFSGVLNIIFGLILIFNPDVTIKIITSLLGIWLIISSLTSLMIILNIDKNTNIFKDKKFVKGILKFLIGIIILTTPIVTLIFTGLVLGIIAIAIGIYIIFNYKEETKVYKVKVKK